MLQIIQTDTYVGTQGVHQWRCVFSLEGRDEELDRVKRVVYTLDPSFARPVRTVDDRATNFSLEILCWASFTLYATVQYEDGSQAELLTAEVALEAPGLSLAAPIPVSDATEVVAPRYEPPVLLTEEADVVLDGGGVRSVAFAAALQAAEDAGIKHWVQIAGSSAGALVASLLAVGYRPTEITQLLLAADYRKLFRSRLGFSVGSVVGLWSNRGLLSTDGLRAWLAERFSESPLGVAEPTFGDLAIASTHDGTRMRARYPLRILVSDLTAARMIVVPDDIEHYQNAEGQQLVADEYSVLDAVLMSMRVPFWFRPDVLHRGDVAHYMLDGGLLSNFPIWIFDSAYPVRPTWGIRLRTPVDERTLAAQEPHSWWRLGRALVRAVMEAARELEPARNEARTLTIELPPGILGPQLDPSQLEELKEAGYRAGLAFFASRGTYLNSLRRGLPAEALVSAQAADLRRPPAASD